MLIVGTVELWLSEHRINRTRKKKRLVIIKFRYFWLTNLKIHVTLKMWKFHWRTKAKKKKKMHGWMPICSWNGFDTHILFLEWKNSAKLWEKNTKYYCRSLPSIHRNFKCDKWWILGKFFSSQCYFCNSTYGPECDRHIEKTIQKKINVSLNFRWPKWRTIIFLCFYEKINLKDCCSVLVETWKCVQNCTLERSWNMLLD